MKLMSKLSAIFMLGFVAVPSTVHAEDDNVYDGKTYPGALCDSAASSVLSARVAPFYANTSGSAAAVICPVIQDSWLSTSNLSYARMFLSNVAGQTFSCTQSAYTADGTLVSSRSFSTTAGGVQGQYFWNGSSYLGTTSEGYIAIQCSVPSGGQIRSYVIQEKAS